MAQDANGDMLQVGSSARISRAHLYYGGTIARVMELHPLQAVTVEMFNGKRFRLSSRDMTLERGA